LGEHKPSKVKRNEKLASIERAFAREMDRVFLSDLTASYAQSVRNLRTIEKKYVKMLEDRADLILELKSGLVEFR